MTRPTRSNHLAQMFQKNRLDNFDPTRDVFVASLRQTCINRVAHTALSSMLSSRYDDKQNNRPVHSSGENHTFVGLLDQNTAPPTRHVLPVMPCIFLITDDNHVGINAYS